jgi:cysteine desulfurase
MRVDCAQKYNLNQSLNPGGALYEIFQDGSMNAPVYLDYNATTPVDPLVAETIEPYLYQHFGNPSSTHVYGRKAHQAVERAREQVAILIGAHADEIVFTGCATEANNLAIRGAARALRDKGRHLITSAVEHPSVEQPFQRLGDDGWEVTVIPVDNYGQVDLAELSDAVRDDTVLVSIMHANNEVGTIQPVEEIAAITRPRGILLHTDAAQSAGKIPVSVDDLGVDLLTLAGHKFYATKGVGVLYVRRGTQLQPALVGAGHEAGLRPGTENVPAIAGLGEAARIADEHKPGQIQQLRLLRDQLHTRLADSIPGLLLNGHPEQRLPNTLNLSFPGVDGRDLLALAAAEVAASVGSACHEEGDVVSGVLGAMGIEADRARGAVRLSLGTPSTDLEIGRAAKALIAAWQASINGVRLD